MSYTLNNIKRNNLITLGLPNDVDYLNYVNDQLVTNIGKLQTIEESFNHENLVAVDSIISNFIDTNTIESNLKLVYEMYLKLQKGDSLSNTDSTNLYDLALADPLLNGDAVFGAAVLLDLDIPWVIDEPRAVNKNKEIINQDKVIEIYPNPTTGKVFLNLHCQNENAESYSYQLYDLTGKEILSDILTCSKITEIDLSRLENSVYTIVINNSKTSIGRYRIIKK